MTRTSPQGIDTGRARSYSEIEGLADNLRRSFGLNHEEKVLAFELFEYRLNEIELDLDGKLCQICTGVQRLETEALSRWNPNKERFEILMCPAWYERLEDGHPRCSFTVAHEIGHVVMHSRLLVKLGSLNLNSQAALHRGNRDFPAYRDSEWQANAFAAAFLMPDEGISFLYRRKPNVSSQEIARHFGVSVRSAELKSKRCLKGRL